MFTFVELVVNIKTHDNKSMLANAAQGNLGPVTTAKTVAFQAMGPNIQEAIAEAHGNLVKFLESEAASIGSEEKAILAPLGHIESKNFKPQRVRDSEDEAAADIPPKKPS